MRLLLVERDRAAAHHLKGSLQGYGFVVSDGGEAEACGPAANQNDAILLGLSRLQEEEEKYRLQAWRQHNGNKILLALLPHRSTVAERVNCLDLGADGYVLRPVDAVELSARLRALGRRRQRSETVVRVHDLEIDVRAWQVRRGGRVIPLTPREFALIQVLAARQGRVVSRSTIRAHLYKHGFEAASNVVDVYIRYLRQKIDRGFATPLILTLRGQGYQLGGSGVGPVGGKSVANPGPARHNEPGGSSA